MLRLLGLLVVVALLVAGLSYWQGGPSGLVGVAERLPDGAKDWVTARAVRTAFSLNRDLGGLPIDVAAESGVITLRGAVPSAELRASAERTAAAVPDVRQVVNHLEVRADVAAAPPAAASRSVGEAFDDEALGAKVRLAFSLNKALDGADVEVAVYRRSVTLAGAILSERQRAEAVRTAGAVAGVASVEDRLRVAGESRPADPRAAVARALSGNEHLAGYRIEVVEEGSRLKLRGRVRSGAERDLAGLLARDAAGTSVDNELTIGS